MMKVSVRVLTSLLAGASLAACQPSGEAGEGGEKAKTAAHGEAGEAAIGESGGEAGSGATQSGEAGAREAYAGVSKAETPFLLINHADGFARAAQKLLAAKGDPAEAAILVEQGRLEVMEPQKAAFASIDAGLEQVFAAAGAADAKTAGAKIDAAIAAADKARVSLGSQGEGAGAVLGMVKIAKGLYANVVIEGAVDPVEYQHSYGAALSAQAALARLKTHGGAKNAQSLAEAESEMARFVGLWPSAIAPEKPVAFSEVSAQAARVELALSGL